MKLIEINFCIYIYIYHIYLKPNIQIQYFKNYTYYDLQFNRYNYIKYLNDYYYNREGPKNRNYTPYFSIVHYNFRLLS